MSSNPQERVQAIWWSTKLKECKTSINLVPLSEGAGGLRRYHRHPQYVLFYHVKRFLSRPNYPIVYFSPAWSSQHDEQTSQRVHSTCRGLLTLKTLSELVRPYALSLVFCLTSLHTCRWRKAVPCLTKVATKTSCHLRRWRNRGCVSAWSGWNTFAGLWNCAGRHAFLFICK